MTTVKDALTAYYRTKTTKDLAKLFTEYMLEIGAKRLDRRHKDTSNTFHVDGDGANWNRVECYYWKDHDAYKTYGKFDFCITFRKSFGNYLLIEVGDGHANIKRPYEISYGEVVYYDEKVLADLVNRHPGLFERICKEVQTKGDTNV